jgi:GT2 family glycosyltransferase
MFIKPTLPTAPRLKVPRIRRAGPNKVQMHRQISALETQVALLEGQVEAMRQSTSWRISAPLRWFSRKLRELKAAPNADSAWRVETYAEWVRLYDTPAAGKRDIACVQMSSRPSCPRISVLVAATAVEAPLFAASIESVLAQDYMHWDLLIAAEPLLLDEVKRRFPNGELQSARIKLVPAQVSASRASTFNHLLNAASGDWVLLLESGDLLPRYALCHLAGEIDDHAEARIIYSDEDTVDALGRRTDPCFKPDWNLDLFHSQDLVSHVAVLLKGLLTDVGGFREGFDGALGYDLVLRCIERVRPEQIRHIPRILCHRQRTASMPLADTNAAEARALVAHLERTGTAALVLDDVDGRRVRYELPAKLPLVTLIIPTRNGIDLLRQCVESIVVATTYPNYEILLVDNGSDEPEALTYLAELKRQPGFAVIRDDRPFNYSQLNNLAVQQARGEVVALINNDIEVISPDWLDEMVSLALQPGVGAVGAKLLYPDETVQHGGVLLGVGGETGVAGHAHKFLPAWRGGYMHRALAVQSFSAVTAACLVVRKALYQQVGGLNEVELKVAYNDVDFCLKLREAGYRNVWTPYAELFHHESATRGADVSESQRHRFDSEQAYMRARWGELIANDPAYNPNLTVHSENFGLAWPPRVPWNTHEA